MNFGQPRLWEGRATSRYVLQVPVDEIYQILSKSYADYLDDALRYPDPDCQLDQSLSRLSWPPLEKLAAQAPDTFQELMAFYDYDILLSIESRHSSRSFTHVIVCVDEVVYRDECVRLAGIVVPLR